MHVYTYIYVCISSVQFRHPVLSDSLWPMDCSTPGIPVLHDLPEFLKFMSNELVMVSNYLILCRSLFLLPSIFPSIRIFSRILALHIRWTKYWSFSFNITPSNEYSELISFRTDWLSNQITDLLSPCCPRDSQESSPTPLFKASSAQHLYSPTHIHTWLLEKP